jgi:hypothetical protein
MKRLMSGVMVVLVGLVFAASSFAAEAMKMHVKQRVPTVSDDSGSGYYQGQFWYDESTRLLFMSYDHSRGAADWRQVATGNVYSTSLTGNTTYGFQITGPSQGNVFVLNPATTTALNRGDTYSTLGIARAGTTVTLPTPTAATDNWLVTIVNATTGVSEIVPYCGGLPIGTTSGTTPGAAFVDKILNGPGESITLLAKYNSAVSWWVVDATAGQIIASPTITSPTVTAGTFTSPTIATPTISSPTLTGTASMSGVTLDNIGMLQIEPQTATYVSGQGYVLSGASVATIYSIPIDSAAAMAATDKCPACPGSVGVTVVVMTPTAANHGQLIGIRNTSGTTAFVLRTSTGLPLKTTSGVTHLGGEDVGDITWIQLSYNTGISVYVVSEFKND